MKKKIQKTRPDLAQGSNYIRLLKGRNLILQNTLNTI